MSTKQINIVVNSTPEVLNPNSKALNASCSCQDCNSVKCFVKRCEKRSCSCNQCKNSKTCLFYSNNNVNLKESCSNNCKITPNSTTESVHSNIDVKSNLYKQDTRTKLEIVNENQKKPLSVDFDDKSDAYKRDRNQDISFTQSSHHELNTSRVQLSAQIMDLPYSNVKESLSYNKSGISSCTMNKYSKYDIFKRIKEVYNACSCKVCECIIGEPVLSKKDLCKCKPCECSECKQYTLKSNFDVNIDQLSGCPCVRCTNKNCRGIVKKDSKVTSCNCKPCDCIKCVESFSKPCHCEPCQCVECKSLSLPKRNTFIVASVSAERDQRNACQCQPCDCIQCGHIYRTTSDVMHEMSTGLNRHQNCNCEACVDESCVPDSYDTCRCERRNSFMRKPVQRDTHDFDIRHAIVADDLTNRDLEITRHGYSGYGTTTMFTALPNNFRRFNTNKKKICNCDNCECVICNCEEKAANSIKSSKLLHATNVLPTISTRTFKTYKYSSCEYQSFLKKLRKKRSSTSDISISEICKCDVCDCLNCEKLNESKYKTKFSTRTVCKCIFCECRDCKMAGFMTDINHNVNTNSCQNDVKSSAIIYPIKRGQISVLLDKKDIIHKEKYKQQQQIENYSNLPIWSKQTFRTGQGKINIPQNDFSICRKLPVNSQYSVSNYYIAKKSQLEFKAQSRYSENKLEERQYKISSKCINSIDSATKNKSQNKVSVSNKEQINSYSFPLSYNNDKVSFNSQTDNHLPFSFQHYFKAEKRSCISLNPEHPLFLKKYPTATNKYINDDIDFNSNKCSTLIDNSTMMRKDIPSKIEYKTVSDYNRRYQRDSEISSHRNKYQKQTTFSSMHIDYPEQHETVSQTNNKCYKKQSYRGFDRGGKISSTQTMLEFNTSRNYINPKTNINFISQIEGQANMSEPEISSNHTSDLTKSSSYSILQIYFSNTNTKHKYLSRKSGNHSLPVLTNVRIDYLNLGTTYKRLRRTLEKARQFSTYLENILETYEKANKDFLSITQNLKVSLSSVINQGSVISKNNFDSGILAITCKDEMTSIICKTSPLLVEDNVCSTETSVKNIKNKNNDGVMANTDTDKHLQKEMSTIKPSDKNSVKSLGEVSINRNAVSMDTRTHSKILKIKSHINVPIKDVETTKDTAIDACYIKGPEAKEICHNLKCNKHDIRDSQNCYEKCIAIPSSTFASAATETFLEASVVKEGSFNDTKNENIGLNLKKSLVDVNKKNTEISLATHAEQIDIQNYVKELLKLSIVYPAMKQYRQNSEKFDHSDFNYAQIPKTASIKSSSEKHKVSFLSVKRVSDHTVLVKWNTPRVITNVQGYELLVDGRSVQKLIKPTKCMAVVTCLPHTEKVMLSIKTIVSNGNQSYQYPTSSVIYRPRSKII